MRMPKWIGALLLALLVAAAPALAADEAGVRVADDADAFAAGKLRAARYFLRRELPLVDAKFDLLAAGDRITLDMRDEWF
mgnify:CR=1 FL=1